MASTTWYHKGLRFKCTGCGDCCTGAPGFVWVNKAEIERLAHAVGLDAESFEEKYVRRVGIRKSLAELAGGDCVLFDNRSRRCKVYEVRPRQCRTWPFWQSNLRTRLQWEQTCEVCPGCGRGPLVSPEQIRSRLERLRV